MRIRLMLLTIGLLIVAHLPNRVPGNEKKLEPARGTKTVWAGISVNQAIFTQEELQDQGALLIKFALVNDSDKPAATDVDSWRIIINGKEMDERSTSLMFGNSSRMPDTLPPGAHAQIARAMGIRFKEPGTYRVSWKGKTFTSPEITFRVLPSNK